MPFIVFSLPRSRSAWMSRFLSYGGARCGHDLAPRCATVKEFTDLLGTEYQGTAETGAIIGWRAIRHLVPDLKIVVVRRRVQDVYDSLATFGLGSPHLMNQLIERAAMLDYVSGLVGVRTFTFDGLQREFICRDLFEFCLGTPFDRDWWKSLEDVDVQINVPEFVQYLIDNHERIEGLKRDAECYRS
jgi:hypothetical protein